MCTVIYLSFPSWPVRTRKTNPERESLAPSGVATAHTTSIVKLVLASKEPLWITPAQQNRR